LNKSSTLNTVSFCEVNATVSYGSGNNSLLFTLWLPNVLEYNNRFMAVGNGEQKIDYYSASSLSPFSQAAWPAQSTMQA